MNITVELVQNLIADQFPEWAYLPITEVQPNGWDNRTFRLGDEMSVRLPSAERYVHQVEKEQVWLPKLAPHLPLPIPQSIAIGRPGSGYPWKWSINGWIDGDTPTVGLIEDRTQFATSLAEFLVALHAIDPDDGPKPGDHNFHRGGDLTVCDEQTRTAVGILDGKIDIRAATEVWNSALDSQWTNKPVWVHGDVSLGNLLVRGGRLSAVIDFGGMCVGDPACDLAIVWTLFRGASREAFRSRIQLDAATWARARGWTIWKALIILSGLSETNAAEAQTAHETVEEILAEHRAL